jgi:glycosyltransferase involved in cell wall biosynthesis
MLGYISAEGRGAGDRLLADLAQALLARGVSVAGVVQINRETRPDRHCDMDLVVLGHDHQVRISQDLGPLARGCRLDPQGLETAVGLVMADLGHAPALVIVNKFGKSEAEGRGFRMVLAEAMMAGIPVLTAVSGGNLEAFLEFAGDLAEPLPAQPDALLAWCAQQVQNGQALSA